MGELAHKSIDSLFRSINNSKSFACHSFDHTVLPGGEKSPTELTTYVIDKILISTSLDKNFVTA